MFTVVIPLFNKELSIKNTIRSVLNQSFQDFEILVVNDGSTDNSVSAVERINDARIRLINQTNQGVSAARNRGIKEAQFEWVAFLDGDDLWETNHLEEIIEMMHSFPSGKCFTTSFVFSDYRKTFKYNRKKNIFEINNYYEEAINENLVWTSTVVIDKHSLKEINGFNPNLTNGEDLDCWARIARHHTIIKSSTVTAVYRVDAENRTSLNKNVEKTHVYNFDLDKSLTKEEKEYYQALILKRMVEYTKVGSLRNIIRLKYKHKEISWFKYLSQLTNVFLNNFNRK